MDTIRQIEQLKGSILSRYDIGKRNAIDKLIELEGMKPMNFFQSILSITTIFF